MSLGHVYIVLEPIGSARLTFDDDRYYEFMCFDVPKVVQSLGCDQRHDEESQNGRDIKIDILEGYVWTPEWFRISSSNYRSTGGYRNPLGSQWALMGHGGKEKEATKWGAPSPQPNTNWRGGLPPFPALLLPLSSSPTPTREGGKPTPTRSRNPPLGRAIGGRPSPPPLLYIRGGGHPIDTQVDHSLSRVRCPPPP